MFSQASDGIEERDLSSFDLNNWVSDRRQRLRAILESGEKDPTQQATHLLEESLNTLILFVEPKLECYRKMILEVLAGRNSAYEEVMEYMAHLQSRLLKIYRQGLLLFHPDHYQDVLREGDNHLASHWNEVFLRYQHHVDTSLTDLTTGQGQLAAYVNNSSKKDQFSLWYARIQKKIHQFTLERHAFRKEMEAKLKEWDKEHDVKLKEMETKLKEQKESCDQLNDQLNEVMKRLGLLTPNEIAAHEGNHTRFKP